MSEQYPLICMKCGTTGSVGRVTASLACPICKTGEHLDLWDGKTAAGPNQSGGGNGSTGWNKQLPNSLENWDEYAGPSVGPNPEAGSHLVGDADAYNDGDWSRGNPDYIPGGGYDNAPRHLGPTTGVPSAEQYDSHAGPQSGGSRWQGKGASLVPLHVTLPDGTQWEGTGRVVGTTAVKAKKKVASKPTRKMQMVAKIRQANPGLTETEAGLLADRSIQQYGDE